MFVHQILGAIQGFFSCDSLEIGEMTDAVIDFLKESILTLHEHSHR